MSRLRSSVFWEAGRDNMAMSYKEKTLASLSCEWGTSLTCKEDAIFWFFWRCCSDLLRETRLWSVERNAALNYWEDAALICWEKRDSELLRETRLRLIEKCSPDLSRKAGLHSSIWWRGHNLQACEGTRTSEHGLWSITCILTRRSHWIFQFEVSFDGWGRALLCFPRAKIHMYHQD